MFTLLLSLHNIVRWLLLLFLIWAILRAWRGWQAGGPWLPADNLVGRNLTLFTDIQIVIGLIVYFLSPLAAAGRKDFGAAMGDAGLRYWTVEHTAIMVVAAVLIHVGRARSRRAATDTGRHRTAAIFFGLALVAILIAVPWPFSAQPRPWFPTF